MMTLETEIRDLETAILPRIAPGTAAQRPDPENTTTRVLHVINGEHYAGAERVQDLLAGRLKELGFDVGFACVKPKRFSTARLIAAPTFPLPMGGRFDLRVVNKIVELIHNEGFELIHAHTPRTALVASLAAQRANLPFVYHVHSPADSDSARPLQNWINALVERWTVRAADRLICVSSSLETHMVRRGFPASAVVCIPNGVPLAKNVSVRQPPYNTWTLGTVALFRPRKGLEVLLQALANLISRGEDVRLRVIGTFETPSYESAIMCLTERLNLGDAIDWVGFTRDVQAELARIDVFVLPSLFGEGLPMVVLEAMSAGLPVVATRVAGITDAVVHRETGLLVEPNRVSHLAQSIEELIQGRLNYSELSRAALARHRMRFSDETMAQRVAEVYRHVLARCESTS